jgi:DNA invertase Pin-like site-specific DNA recombinase
MSRCPAKLDAGDVLIVTRLDRLARSNARNTVATIAGKGAGFPSLGGADTTTPRGRLKLRQATAAVPQ